MYMQHSIINMNRCPRRLPGVLLALAAFLSCSGNVFARDASVPYRNLPGFACHRWNSLGECSDFSYFDQKTAPVTRPSLYPTGSSPRTAVRYGCSGPTVDCTGSVSVRATASKNTVIRGEQFTYTLYVRNDDSQYRNVTLRAYLNDNVRFESATFGGFTDGNTIRWDTQRMAPGTSRTILLRVRVQANASTGFPVEMRVVADRSADVVTTTVLDGAEWNSNAIRIRSDGVYVQYGNPPRYRRLDDYAYPQRVCDPGRFRCR
jgi:hypothetical protein